MKKKVLSMFLVAAMAASMVVGCGGNGDADTPSTDGGDQQEVTDYGSGTITIWVAEAVVDFTKAKAEEFLASDEAYSGYTVDVQAVGEGDAAGNVITDVAAGADIYGFAQDQLARLVSAGALNPLSEEYAKWVTDSNDELSVNAAKVGDMVYAFPITSDNGYFLYYDKSVVTDPTSLEKIASDCAAAGKNFYMEINSGWYQTAFFFGAGCNYTYETNVEGKYTSCDIDYNSDAGLVALKEMIELASSPAFQNGSSIDKATNLGAIVDGTWDSGPAKEVFGDNFACAKLPSFEGSDGATHQMTGFSGYKLLGIKPQEDAGKLALCYLLAQYLTNAETQVARYEEAGWGPSNLEAQENDAVKNDVALTALREQMAVAVPQGQYPDGYWDLAKALGDDIMQGNISASTSDDDLKATLKNFEDTCKSYVNAEE